MRDQVARDQGSHRSGSRYGVGLSFVDASWLSPKRHKILEKPLKVFRFRLPNVPCSFGNTLVRLWRYCIDDSEGVKLLKISP